MSSQYNATVVGRYEVTSELFLLHVSPDDSISNFIPGQYVAVGLLGNAPRCSSALPDKEIHEEEKLIKRAYSIGSSPEHKEYLELYIALVPDGGLTPRLASLERGDRLFVSPKITGTFTLKHIPEENSATIVMVATGTGLAPFMSMLRTKSSWHPERTFALIHGVRFEKDLAYRDELMKLEESSEKLQYFPVVSRETPSSGILQGRVLTVLEKQLLTLNSTFDHVLLCGNPAMVEDVQKYLEPLGFSVYSKKNPTGNLHLEKYW